MSVQSVALASLTATYTDSEGDEGLDDEHRESTETPLYDVHQQNSNVTRQRSSPMFDHTDVNSDEFFVNDHNDDRHRNVVDDRSRKIKRKKNDVTTIVKDVKSRIQRLVSYFDDTVVSDDEMGIASGLNDNQDVVNGTTTFNDNKNAMQSPKRRGELVSDCEDDNMDVAIPPEPPGHCPAELQDKITNLYRKMENGLDMNVLIQQRKEFRNPSIYEKLIQFCSINEMGTNYPPDRFDPLKWGKDSYYEELARIQKTEMDKLERTRKEKTKIEIVTGTAKRPTTSSGTTTTAEDDAKRRKSKWDQVATGTSASVKSNVVIAQPTLTTLTSSATGTKATVISAFGSLPKKRL